MNRTMATPHAAQGADQRAAQGADQRAAQGAAQRADQRADQHGSVSLWLVLAAFAMVILAGLAVDLGGQVHSQQRAHDLAAQAARTGAQQVQAAPAIQGRGAAIDATRARAAAQDYLAAAGVSGSVTITAPDQVTVTVHDDYRPQFLELLGINRLPVTATADARLIRTVGDDPR